MTTSVSSKLYISTRSVTGPPASKIGMLTLCLLTYCLVDPLLAPKHRNSATTRLHKLPKKSDPTLLRQLLTKSGTAEAGEDQETSSPADPFTAQHRKRGCQSLPTWPRWMPHVPASRD